MVEATGTGASEVTDPNTIWIGIDLGTVNSCVSYCDTNNGNRFEMIPNQEGDETTPSSVYFKTFGEEPLVGKPAQNAAVIYN